MKNFAAKLMNRFRRQTDAEKAEALKHCVICGTETDGPVLHTKKGTGRVCAPCRNGKKPQTPSGVRIGTTYEAYRGSLPTHVADALNLTLKPKKGSKVRSEKFRARLYRLPPGTSWNPLVGFPRNAKCFCDSGKKFKVCCSGLLANCVKTEFATYVNKNWGQLVTGKLTFPGKKLPIPGGFAK
jgi:hypothetical protein